MKKFKIIVLSAAGHAKYTYNAHFEDIKAAIDWYQVHGGRVIEVKEMGVRFAKREK